MRKSKYIQHVGGVGAFSLTNENYYKTWGSNKAVMS